MASRTGLRFVLALQALVLLAACGGGSPPSPPAPTPLSFSRSVKVGGFCCLLYTPRLGASGDRLFVAWTQAIRYTTSLPLRGSTDGGLSFPMELPFVDASTGDRDAIRLSTAPDGALHLAWEDSREGQCDPFCRGYRVYATRSTDGGASFAPNRPIDGSSPGEQSNPTLAVAADGAVFGAWQDTRSGRSQIHFARSLDRGASFEPAVRVDAGAGAAEQRSPAIALQPEGRIYLAWLDARSGSPQVYLSRSFDRGASFGAGAPLHPAAPEVTDRAGIRLAVTGAGRLVAAWSEKRGGRWGVVSAVSLDGGASFTQPRNVDTSALADQDFPALAVYGAAEVYLGWEDARSGAERVRVARSTNGGDTFEPSVAIDEPGAVDGDQRQPELGVDARGSVLAVWVDFSKPDSGVYFARSVR